MKALVCAVSLMLAAGAVGQQAQERGRQEPGRQPPGAQEPGRQERGKPIRAKTTKASYQLRGLECGACATTLEGSLKKAKGITSVDVDFQTKRAVIEFDERVLSAQEVARTIDQTSHMMGAEKHYGGALLLRVSGLKENDTATKAKDTLGKIEGVTKVTPNEKQQTIAIDFGAKGKVTSKQLLDALAEAGLQAGLYAMR